MIKMTNNFSSKIMGFWINRRIGLESKKESATHNLISRLNKKIEIFIFVNEKIDCKHIYSPTNAKECSLG